MQSYGPVFIGRWREPIYSIARFVAGAAFAQHGAQKLFGVLGAAAQRGDPWTMTAGVIEFFGGVMVAIGLIAGVVAFVASGEMAVAYFRTHAPLGFWPIENHGEPAVVYCFVFLLIATIGSGAWSVDALWSKPKSGGSTAS